MRGGGGSGVPQRIDRELNCRPVSVIIQEMEIEKHPDDGFPLDGGEAGVAAFRTAHTELSAELEVNQRGRGLATVHGTIVARRHAPGRRGGVPRLFLDLQAGVQRLQLFVPLPPPDDGQSAAPEVGSAGAEGRRAGAGASKPAPPPPLPLIQPGTRVRATGWPYRMPGRGMLALEVEAADLVAAAPIASGLEPAPAPRQAGGPRFHMTPRTTCWQTALGKLFCGAHNDMVWTGELPVPAPPAVGCWLLPATDGAAVGIARRQAALRAAGWRILSCDEQVIRQLSNKVAFRDHAAAAGLLEHLPTHYSSAADARFPCIRKASEGNHGDGVQIIPTLEWVQL